MKFSIIKSLSVLCAGLALAACSDDSSDKSKVQISQPNVAIAFSQSLFRIEGAGNYKHMYFIAPLNSSPSEISAVRLVDSSGASQDLSTSEYEFADVKADDIATYKAYWGASFNDTQAKGQVGKLIVVLLEKTPLAKGTYAIEVDIKLEDGSTVTAQSSITVSKDTFF